MPRDYKTGLVLGLILVVVAGLWLATRPSLSTKMLLGRSAESQEDIGHGRDSTEWQAGIGAALNNDDSTRQPDAAVPRQTVRIHIVQQGETLSQISSRYYSTANQWQKILNANRNAIEDPGKIRPGTRLFIPQ